MLKLLPSEVEILEGLKAGKKVTQIGEEFKGKGYGYIWTLVNNLVELGVVTRDGKPKRYKYKVVDKPYEIIQKREKEVVPQMEDTLIDHLVDFTLSDYKIQFLQANYQNLTRSELSKKLGITKLELNFLMHKLNLKQKEIK